MARNLFSYRLVDGDEAGDIYRKMLSDDVDKVVAWRDAKSGRATLPPDGLFEAWWIQNGPTAFVSGTDAVRYRRELLVAFRERLRGPE